jgi:hypothetical protein
MYEDLGTKTNATQKRSLGSVGGCRLIFLSWCVYAFQRGTVVAFQQSFHDAPSGFMALSEHGAQLAILVGLVLVWFYFYLRRAIARDEALQKPRWR